MKIFLVRTAGSLLLAACIWWWLDSARDFTLVSPVHWSLMLPHAVLAAVPVLTGGLAGGTLLLRGRGGKTLLLVFAITLAQAFAVSVLSPDIRTRYKNTVRETVDSLMWAPSSSQPDSST
ncbi:MAG: hypothetical protein ACE5FJ_02255 [Gemmatimonadales bacterium]